ETSGASSDKLGGGVAMRKIATSANVRWLIKKPPRAKPSAAEDARHAAISTAKSGRCRCMRPILTGAAAASKLPLEPPFPAYRTDFEEVVNARRFDDGERQGRHR